VVRIRVVVTTLHLPLGRESWWTVVPILSQIGQNVASVVPSLQSLFDRFLGWIPEATHLSITRRTGSYLSVRRLGGVFNHIRTRTSRATWCGSGAARHPMMAPNIRSDLLGNKCT
jgi:hypothetical protein